jgi:hypothetical protein
VVFCGTALGAEADSPLAYIPEDALIVARAKTPLRLVATLATWIPASFHDSVMPFVSAALATFGQSADPAAECWVVDFPSEANAKSWVYLVQARDVSVHAGDLGKIKQSYADAVTHTTIGKWHVFAGTTALGARINDCRAGKIKSLAAAMDPKARELFESESVSVFINAKRLRAIYRNQLDEFKRMISASVQECSPPAKDARQVKPALAAGARNAGPGLALGLKIDDPKTFEGLVTLWRGVDHLIEDTDCVAVGLTVDDKGCELSGYVGVATNSPTDRFFARHPPSEMKPLERLPAGSLAYFGLSGELTELARWIAQAKIGMLERPATVLRAIEQKLEPSSQGPVEGYFGSFDFGRDTMGPGASSLVVQGGSTPKLREFESRLIELTNATVDAAPKGSSRAQSPALNGAVKRNAETISRQGVDLAITKLPVGWDGSSGEASIGDVIRAILKAYYGASDLVATRTANRPGVLLRTTGGGPLVMAQLLRNFESESGPVVDPAWKRARLQAGPRANAILMLDLPRCAFAYLQVTILAVLQDPKTRADIAKLEKDAPVFLRTLDPSYSVLAVTTEPHAARCRIHVPREQVIGLFRLYEFITNEFEVQAAPVAKPTAKAPVDEQ